MEVDHPDRQGTSAKLHVLFFGLRVLNKEQKEQKV